MMAVGPSHVLTLSVDFGRVRLTSTAKMLSPHVYWVNYMFLVRIAQPLSRCSSIKEACVG
jgi:hypothetical protein